MSSFCGLRPLRLKKTRVISEHANSLLNFAAEHSVTPTTATFFQATATTTSSHSNQNFDPNNDYSSREGTSGKGKHHDWARDDQLSIILEVLDAETKRTPGNELEELNWGPPKPPKSRHQYKGGHTLANVREVPGEESPTTDLVPLDSKAKGKYIAGSRDHSPHPTIPPKSANRTARVDSTANNTEKDRNINKSDEVKEYIVGAPPGHRPVLTRRKGDKLLVQTPGSSRDLVLRQHHPQHHPHHRQQEFLWNGTGNRYREMESRGESSRTGREPVRRPSFDTSAPVTPQSSKSEPRAIQAPPRDLESIARIDASLVFEHFTTTDAWELGCALRTRLLPISTPVVIDISLANQDQTLFHTCTHSGIMPDNDSWVARKRRTVLRWGVSTWYMSCKFGGDERAFAIKYGLGEKGGEYAIHGGGVPIRVRGVEGVVAVVVVSGLKQDEDHGVIVECIRELYY